MDESVISLALRMILGVTFLASASTKLRANPGLAQVIERYGLGFIRPRWAVGLSHLAAPGEGALGLALLLGLWTKPAALAALVFLAALTFSITVNLRRGVRFPCHCFGAKGSPIGIGILLRNALLLVIALLLAIFAPWIPQIRIALSADMNLLLSLDALALTIITTDLFVLMLILSELDPLISRNRVGPRKDS